MDLAASDGDADMVVIDDAIPKPVPRRRKGGESDIVDLVSSPD